MSKPSPFETNAAGAKTRRRPAARARAAPVPGVQTLDLSRVAWSMKKRAVDGPFAETKELLLGNWPFQKTAPGRYASVNGLRMYYETHGQGTPLVLLHGALSTIDFTFGEVLPLLAHSRRVIALEQQAHGRTSDIDRPLSQEQMADDAAELLRQLGIRKADFLGYSMGATTALQVAVRHPGLVRKLAIVSGSYKNEGNKPEILHFMRAMRPDYVPLDSYPMDATRRAEMEEMFRNAPHIFKQWPASVARIKETFLNYRGLYSEDLRAIRAPTLFFVGDRDVIRPDHTQEMVRLVPRARLHVVPDADHLAMVGRSAPLIPAFLEEPLR
jgi:pimeloyl-ACP methyl ester carboxylesterase